MVSRTDCCRIGRHSVLDIAVMVFVSILASSALPVGASGQCKPSNNLHCLTVTLVPTTGGKKVSVNETLPNNTVVLNEDPVKISYNDKVEWQVAPLTSTKGGTDLFVLFPHFHLLDTGQGPTFHTVDGGQAITAQDMHQKVDDDYKYAVVLWDGSNVYFADPIIQVGSGHGVGLKDTPKPHH
jgi:hypothetical protein